MTTPLSIEELQKLLSPTPSEGEEVLDWTMRMLQAKSAMDQAVFNFSAITDREIAAKAAFKAMGLDPRDAPVFGWNMSERPKQTITSQIINNPVQRVTASEQQPDRPVSPPSQGGGGQVPQAPVTPSAATGGIGQSIRTFIGATLVAALAALLTYLGTTRDMKPDVPSNSVTVQQQQLVDKLKEVQAVLQKPGQFTALQTEICQELESDPAFRDEIKRDLQAIAQKILTHKQSRLGGTK